jgi:hypothetical protein
MVKLFIVALTAALAIASTQAAEMPVVHVGTLAGKSIVLPRETAGSLALLVIGFTRDSGEVTATWSRRLGEDATVIGAVKTFQVAVLEDVPRLVRRFAVSQIQASVPDALRATFLIVTERADLWKTLAAFENDDSAYLVLIGTRGEVRWRARGALSEQRYQDLLHAIASAEAASHAR